MVCPKCREQQHEQCRRGTWCDCQCKVPKPGSDQLAEPGILASMRRREEQRQSQQPGPTS